MPDHLDTVIERALKRSKVLINRESARVAAAYIAEDLIARYDLRRRQITVGHRTLEMD